MIFVTFLIAIYYNMIIAWSLFYTFAGFQSQLPWEFCGNGWNTRTCYTKPMADNCTEVLNYSTYWNNKCIRVEEVCNHYDFDWAQNELDTFNVTKCYNTTSNTSVALEEVYVRTSACEEYYSRVMLGIEDDTTWENYGGLRRELVL